MFLFKITIYVKSSMLTVKEHSNNSKADEADKPSLHLTVP